jgi:hypothetical protein
MLESFANINGLVVIYGCLCDTLCVCSSWEASLKLLDAVICFGWNKDVPWNHLFYSCAYHLQETRQPKAKVGHVGVSVPVVGNQIQRVPIVKVRVLARHNYELHIEILNQRTT